MFAFSIWDNKEKTLFLVRDRYGIKPLYYSNKDGIFVFASEIKGFYEIPNMTFSLSLEALDLYLTFEYIPAPWSIYENIFKYK